MPTCAGIPIRNMGQILYAKNIKKVVARILQHKKDIIKNDNALFPHKQLKTKRTIKDIGTARINIIQGFSTKLNIEQ